jgi:SIT4-associating protein SAP185/190
VQTAAGDFIKAIITISANASQNEQQCIGPNELTRQLVSKPCVEKLIGYMLGGGNPLTVGVGIVIEVIRKNNSDYDPDVGAESNAVPSSHDPIYLGTLLRMFAQNVPKFMDLILGAPSQKKTIDSTFGDKLEPLGFDRFKTCELMAELLHCSNMGLLNEVGAEQLIAVRDAERQRLRTDGKLSPQKEEDLSTDDLTMRTTHPAPEEGRRLEVTNADDDGFEEVEPSKEMSEDTSDEFVKAEDDIASARSNALLSKDEDDLVDEPLSSPRLAVPANKIKEQQFDEPDLVVAPLSPSKPKPAEPVSTTASAVGESAKSSETKPIESPIPEAPSPRPGSLKDEPMDDSDELTLPIIGKLPPPKYKHKVTTPPAGEDRRLSPRPEDTPAPLFSAPPAPDSGAKNPPTPEQAAKDTEPETETPATEAGPSDAAVSGSAPENAEGSTSPVVGDYLKAQFVEHRVVPTILVRPDEVSSHITPNLTKNIFFSHSSSNIPGTTSYTMSSTTSFSRCSMALWTEGTILS